MLITILSTVIVLGVLIFVHELGHFVTAKLVDIEVPRFSIGLGPRLIGFKRGETEYVISWLPLGGYVKMAGMEEMERIEGGDPAHREVVPADIIDAGIISDSVAETTSSSDRKVRGPRDFESKSIPARILVISAGVIMNMIFALVVFSGIFYFYGVERSFEPRVARVRVDKLPEGSKELASIPPGARLTVIGSKHIEQWQDVDQAVLTSNPGPVTFQFEHAPAITITMPQKDSLKAQILDALEPEAIIGTVVSDMPAAAAGIQARDRVISAAGKPIQSWRDLTTIIEGSPGVPVPLTIQRGTSNLTVTVVPKATEQIGPKNAKRTVGLIGVRPVFTEKPSLGRAVGQGARKTWQFAALTVGFLKDLFTGHASPRNLGGPILIGQLSGQVARAGLEAFLSFMALMSVNLAVLNLLPIPVLDGGHLMFLLIEAVRGRALSIEQRMRFSQIGFVIVVAIMVWAIANDVLRLFGL